MITLTKEIALNKQNQLYMSNYDSDTLIFDIETTGLSKSYSMIYIIGFATIKNNSLYFTQLFAETKEDEAIVIDTFSKELAKYKRLVTFNGNRFDIPFVQARASHHGIGCSFDQLEQIDLYQIISKYKAYLKLENYKQKTIEQYLGIYREDSYNGGQLIDVYKEYLKHPTNHALKILQLHNLEDVIDMKDLFCIMAYDALFEGNFTITSVETIKPDTPEAAKQKLLIQLDLSLPLPKKLSFMLDTTGCSFSGNDTKATFCVPIEQETIKYYYEDYRNYFYLPDEDMAIHKSIATYVDSSHRIKATPATCYQKITLSKINELDFNAYIQTIFHIQ